MIYIIDTQNIYHLKLYGVSPSYLSENQFENMKFFKNFHFRFITKIHDSPFGTYRRRKPRLKCMLLRLGVHFSPGLRRWEQLTFHNV